MADSNLPTTMRAWQYRKYGGGASGLEKVNDKPVPKPGKGKLLVRVHAASVNPFDWKVQDGVMKPFAPGKFPYVPGVDVVGTVMEVGPGAGGSFAVGDRIVSYLSIVDGGAFAEYGLAQAKVAAKLPGEVSSQDAAGLPVAAITVLQMLRACGIATLDGSYEGNVLVLGASGGVGHYAVQVAKLSGAFVTATCRARNFDFVKSLGADEVIDYKTPEGQAMASPSGKIYDIVLDCSPGAGAQGYNAVCSKLSQRGKFIVITPNLGVITKSVSQLLTFSSKRLLIVMCSPTAKDLEAVVALLAAGKLKTAIDTSFPLDKAADAWAKSIDGHAVGKIIISVS